MKRWRNKLLLGGVAALAVAALPALGQGPESLLPPGFGDPEPAPKAEPRPEPAVNVAEPAPDDDEVTGPAVSAPPDVLPVEDSSARDLERLPPTRPSYTFDVPPGALRPTDVVGVLEPENWGLGSGAFGAAGGTYLATLMRRLEAPLPSRWTSMLLRRALLSRVPAPRTVDPVDWVAERAALLLRMGEADAARMLAQSVDIANYTPRMIEVGFETAMATADPAALCPMVEPGRAAAGERQPLWRVADSVCAALAGEAARASALIDQARSGRSLSAPDLLLAEKVIGAGTDARRAVDVNWDEVDGLTPWRFGLAGATGMQIPDRLLAGGGPRMHAWYARAPMVPVEQRLASARIAAALGVFSSSALVEMHGLMFAAADPEQVGGTPAGRLRAAYVHRDPAERLGALRGLWDEGEGPLDRYAQLILTAAAAAGLPPTAEAAGQAHDLIAAMLAAGLDGEAARWSDIASSGEADPRAWALLAVGSARPAVDLGASSISTFQGADESEGDLRTAHLVAALTGLGRLDQAQGAQLLSGLGVDLARETRWTRALDAAARERQPGTVALLAAVGMQTGSWSGVPAAHLFRIVRALRQVGLEFEARMIAAEAVTRL